MDREEVIKTMVKIVTGEELTKEEQKNIEDWINKNKSNEQLYNSFTNNKLMADALEKFDNINTKESLERIRTKIFGVKKKGIIYYVKKIFNFLIPKTI